MDKKTITGLNARIKQLEKENVYLKESLTRLTDPKKDQNVVNNKYPQPYLKAVQLIWDMYPFFAYLMDEERTIVAANKAFVKQFGKPDNRKCYQVFLCEDEKCDQCSVEKMKKNGRPIVWDFKLKKRIYKVYNEVFVNGKGDLILGFGYDITRLKKTEDLLKLHKKRLERANEIAMLGHFEYHIPSGVIYPSADMLKVFGLQKMDKMKEEEYRNIIHPDEREQVFEELKETLKHGNSPDQVFRITTPAGHVKFIRVKGAVRRKKKDGAERFFAVVQDVTELKESERKIKKSEEIFRSFFENSGIGIYRTTPDGRILMANKVAVQLLGYDSFEELQGRNLEMEGFEPEYPRKEFKRILDEEGVVNGVEANWRDKNGNNLFVREHAVAIKDEQGQILYYNGTFEDITQEKKVENELKERKRQLDYVLSGSNDGFWDLDLTTNKAHVSERFCEILEMKNDHDQIDPELFLSLLDSEDAKVMRQRFYSYVESKKRESFERVLQIKTPASEPKWVKIKGKNVEFDEAGKATRISGMLADITEEMRLRKNLEQNEAKYKALFEFTPVSIWEKDYSEVKNKIDKLIRENEIENFEEYLDQHPEFFDELVSAVKPLDVNFTAIRLFEATSKKHLLDESRKIYSGESRLFFKKAFSCVANHNLFFYSEDVNYTLKGKKLNVIVRWTNTPGHEEDYSRVYVTHVDISHLKRTAEELRKAKEKAESSDRLKSAFLANMSHEIRTPMNSIVGFSEVLEEAGYHEKDRVKFVRIIKENSNYLLGLIDDIIDLSKIEAGQLKLFYEKVDLNAALKEIQQQFSDLIKRTDKDIDLRLKKPTAKEKLFIKTDPLRFRQIMNNLISNAIKFTDRGYIEFGYVNNNEYIEFYVRDTGIGIPSDKHKLIFERFARIEEKGRKLVSGTGLGLAITRQLIHLLGGEIMVESEVGKGSTFLFTLPFIKGEKKEAEKNKTAALPHKMEWKNHHVLIVEDTESSYEYLKYALRQTGIQIYHALNGIDALSIFKARGDIDLVLMDLRIGGLDGFEATRYMKKLKPEIPVIAQTAYVTTDVQKKCREYGFDEYLSKPLNKEKLLNAIGKYL